MLLLMEIPRSLQLFEVFLDGDIKSLDAFMDAYIKVPTTEGFNRYTTEIKNNK